jgi:hypothetical protein
VIILERPRTRKRRERSPPRFDRQPQTRLGRYHGRPNKEKGLHPPSSIDPLASFFGPAELSSSCIVVIALYEARVALYVEWRTRVLLIVVTHRCGLHAAAIME